MPLSDDLRHANEDLWERMVTCPFVGELGDGGHQGCHMASGEKHRGVSSGGAVGATCWGQLLRSSFSSLSQRDFRIHWIGQMGMTRYS